MIRYLIIDDEHIAHAIIEEYCSMLPNMQLKKNCYDALEALDYLRNHTVDLIFLDLNMPKLKGFDFLKTLASAPKIIVTTAYQEYAIEGYELNIIDYLLKPFGFERFLKAINKISSLTSKVSINPGQDEYSRSIFLRADKKHIQIFIGMILYVEASGNYVKVITKNDNSILVREKLSDLMELLPKNDFMQVHKSFAVAIKHIKSVEGNRIKIGDFTIPIGKLYKINVNGLLNSKL
ncbi:LytTR family DNA-binding domain-containing protein [Flavobacterium sp. CFBP9031]|uniref:LytR/AlgR family response regulator transcription factor n=1 Tax=Flavobacterium sp. CFBP9031 TaxID=3096538 RepID=UPI002A69ED3C|nr:LytTR family DNA-binding domain-containing protein [Flavobacterium sp. CFBP9031]MDY0986610.1 LytTR family DNA-binding domain-containing protein [Flavobacterium sp. CFBP9031]